MYVNMHAQRTMDKLTGEDKQEAQRTQVQDSTDYKRGKRQSDATLLHATSCLPESMR